MVKTVRRLQYHFSDILITMNNLNWTYEETWGKTTLSDILQHDNWPWRSRQDRLLQIERGPRRQRPVQQTNSTAFFCYRDIFRLIDKLNRTSSVDGNNVNFMILMDSIVIIVIGPCWLKQVETKYGAGNLFSNWSVMVRPLHLDNFCVSFRLFKIKTRNQMYKITGLHSSKIST